MSYRAIENNRLGIYFEPIQGQNFDLNSFSKDAQKQEARS
jgi:hypothetical protein